MPHTTTERNPRQLTDKELLVRSWIKRNHGILSRVARETGVSITFANRIAYNRMAQSQDFRVEKKLIALGCPLIQSIPH